MKSTQARDPQTVRTDLIDIAVNVLQRKMVRIGPSDNPEKVICNRLNTVLLIIFLWMNRKRSDSV